MGRSARKIGAVKVVGSAGGARAWAGQDGFRKRFVFATDLLCDGVVAGRCDEGDAAHRVRRQHDLVIDEHVLLHLSHEPRRTRIKMCAALQHASGSRRTNLAENIAAGDLVANLEVGRLERPTFAAVERVHVDTTRQVHAVRHLRDVLQRPLDTCGSQGCRRVDRARQAVPRQSSTADNGLLEVGASVR